MATKNLRTLPPYAEIAKEGVTVTKNNIGIHIQGWPYDWSYPNRGYNVAPIDNRTRNPFNSASRELITTANDSAGWTRLFYPAADWLWNPISGIGNNVLKAFLNTLDVYQALGIKCLWTPQVYVGVAAGERWAGYNQETAAGEQAVVDFLTAILTSTATAFSLNGDGTGSTYTLATHPALGAFEISNEQLHGGVASSSYPAYARAARISVKLFAKYKPACLVVGITSTGGIQGQICGALDASAASLIPLAVGPTGFEDDGTGKQGAHYLTCFGHHWYNFNADSVTAHYADVANNGTCSRLNKNQNDALVYGVLQAKSKYDRASGLWGVDMATIPVWQTEGSQLGLETLTPYTTGWRPFMDTEDERFHDLIRWYLPTLMATQDGAGGLGVSFMYHFDIAGATVTDTIFTLTDISDAADGTGDIKATFSGAPTGGWITNMSCVVTAATGGWADLGLLAGGKKRLQIRSISGNTVIFRNTTYTAPPTNPPTATVFNPSWTPFPEEFKRFVDLVTSGPVTFGWIQYPNAPYQGVFMHVEGVGTWYTTSTGEVRQW